jgi:hypothetical protein
MGLKRVKGEKCAGGKISKDRITVLILLEQKNENCLLVGNQNFPSVSRM